MTKRGEREKVVVKDRCGSGEGHWGNREVGVSGERRRCFRLVVVLR